MSVRYQRLSIDDDTEHSVDFSSAFSFQRDMSKYRSAFSYRPVHHYEKDFFVDFHPSTSSIIFTYVIIVISHLIVLLTLPVSLFFCLKKIRPHERMVVFRLGRLQEPKEPGCVFVIPIIDTWKTVDVGMKAFSVPPTEVLSRDGAILQFGAEIYYHVTDAAMSVSRVQNIDHSMRTMGRTLLMKHTMKREFEDITRQKAQLVEEIQEEMNTSANKWGYAVDRIELSELRVLKEPPPRRMLPISFNSLGSAMQGAMMTPGMWPSKASAGSQPSSSSDADEKDSFVEKILENVQKLLFDPEFQPPAALFQIELTGDSGGVFYLDLKQRSAGRGECPTSPDVIVRLSTADAMALASTQLSPMQAYIGGRMQIEGDVRLALELKEIFTRVFEK